MDIITCIFMSLCLLVADGFTVRGPSAPLSAPLGSSVVLPCYVDEALPVEDLEVEWRRADSETLVHLYQDGESRAEVQQQDYHDRAHFFTEEIQHGNFSLRLDNLTAQDEGEYRCRVHSQQDSGETVAQIKVSNERLLVSGSNRPASAYVGEDVTLNCSVDSHITPEHIEEVSWLKTDEDGDFLVLLYQNKETLPDSSNEQFRGRVEFFTAEIPKGNFSLRLKSVRTEDKGVYMCQVFAGDLSANATVELERLGFSSLHIAVLFFSVAAGSGAVLLLCSLIYCRYKNTVSSSTIWILQLSLVLFPNICMFLAFILWGFTEGSLHETISCSALYILRPVMLIWALSCLKYLQESLKPWTSFFTPTREFAVFTLVVYSVLFSYGWRKRAHETDSTLRVVSGFCFGVVVLMCLMLSTGDVLRLFKRQRERILTLGFENICCFFIIVSLVFFELLQLFSSFGFASLGPFGLFVVEIGCMLLLVYMLFFLRPPAKCLCRTWIVALWIITISVLDIIIVIYIHLVILEREKERLEWTCVISFLHVLKIIMMLVQVKKLSETLRIRQQTETSEQGSNTLSPCNEVMYMFGAVGVVLLSSVSLTAELILKALNGERVIEDLRVIVFPSESAFAFYWLLLQTHAHLKVLIPGSADSLRNNAERLQLMRTTEL
nr:uncharacterized protein LOC556776 isoform X1 [Danio rerio]|eukprot:XP_021328638.1 uncharacterized protein LOC556776 isoform X1 [Danio rerio]